jgi:hypothetical protein
MLRGPLSTPIFLAGVVAPVAAFTDLGMRRSFQTTGGTSVAIGAVTCSTYLTFIANVALTPWYYIPAWVIFPLFFAAGAEILVGRTKNSSHLYFRLAPAAVTSVIVAIFSVTSMRGAYVFADSQRHLDYYRYVAVDVSSLVPTSEAVYLEPAGYMGYFGGFRLLDFPGLVAPEVSRALARIPIEQRSIDAMLPLLEPKFVLFRQNEEDGLRSRSPQRAQWFDQRYQLLREWPLPADSELKKRRDNFRLFGRIGDSR